MTPEREPPPRRQPAGSCCARLGGVLAGLPRCTLALIVLELGAGLALTVTSMAGAFSGPAWLSLNMQRTFGGLELWRLASAPLVACTIFQAIIFAAVGGPLSFALERRVGGRVFLGLVFYAVLSIALLTAALTALVALPPGIRDVPYFAAQWTSDAAVGPEPLALFLVIMGVRLTGVRAFTCCFGCPIPAWAMILGSALVCQLMLYPPWEGVLYTLAGAVAPYLLPRRIFPASQPPEEAPLLAGEGEPSAAPEPPSPREEFQGQGRTL